MEGPLIVEGCDEWRYQFAHEQQAFTKYFRPTLEHGVDFIDVPCDEGAPAFQLSSSEDTADLVLLLAVSKWLSRAVMYRTVRISLVDLQSCSATSLKKRHHERDAPLAFDHFQRLGD